MASLVDTTYPLRLVAALLIELAPAEECTNFAFDVR